MRLATIYTPGSYGTFISWCVYSFSELNQSDDIVSPLDTNGSGHKFWGMTGNDIIKTSHDWVAGEYDGYILIRCDKEKIIDYIDNQLQKLFLDDTNKYLETIFPEFITKLNESWGGNSRWETRELLSFFLPDIVDNIKIEIDSNQSNPNIHNFYKIIPENFLLDITNEIKKLLIFFNLKKHNKFNLLESYVNDYLLQQRNFKKFEKINTFITNTINNVPCTIDNLTIFSEAYIQSVLRQQGFQIQCYELNEFPANSIDLFKLLK